MPKKELETKSSYLIEPHFLSYLNDESNLISDGFAEKVFFPRNENELSKIVKEANKHGVHMTISGGGTGVSGGRVPQSGWIIATDKLRSLSTRGTFWQDDETGTSYEIKFDVSSSFAHLTVPAGMPLKCIQKASIKNGWLYPPDPTEKLAFIGGNIATNASGARSFKFGATRNWIQALRIILPCGELINLSRKDEKLTSTYLELQTASKLIHVPIPSYRLPKCKKNVSGPVILPGSHALDLFIGTEGIFGIVTEATLRLIKLPDKILSIFAFCKSFKQALKLAEIARSQRDRNNLPVPLSVEFLDENSLKCIRSSSSHIPEYTKCAVILEQASQHQTIDFTVEFWNTVFQELDIIDSNVAQTSAEILKHKELRHTVPKTINRMCIKNGEFKLGTDYCVPALYTREAFEIAFSLGMEFEKFQENFHQNFQKPDKLEDFGFALWAHIGDSHIHLNFIPRNNLESIFAKKLMIKFMVWVVEVGGSIAAEHGLGKKKFEGITPLYYQYGRQGIDEIRKIKEILDPNFLLNRGNLIDVSDCANKLNY